MIEIAVIVFPGSNCERETLLALKRAGMHGTEFLWNRPSAELAAFDGYVIVGGFSYEDRSRAGIIAALDPIVTALKQESEKGKPLLGICNGAQILVESGLVPGLENYKVGLALTENERILQNKIVGTGYYNAWVHIRLSENYQRNAFTRHLKAKDVLTLPVAHAEGRFVLTPALLEEVKAQGLNVFQYCDSKGELLSHFPINPNGSIDNIAAMSNKQGNVLAMMPHPERTALCDAIFTSMRDYIQAASFTPPMPLYYHPRKEKIQHYAKPLTAFECIVELVITDNHARSVETTLHHLGFPVEVKRYVHWEIHCENETVLKKILLSDELYNPRKEKVVSLISDANANTYLVRAKQDVIGRKKLQTLKKQLGIAGIDTIKYGLLWQFSTKKGKMTDPILTTNIIANPYAHECLNYT